MEECMGLVSRSEGRRYSQPLAGSQSLLRSDSHYASMLDFAGVHGRLSAQTAIQLADGSQAKVDSPSKYSYTRSIAKQWALEVVSCLLGCAALAAIVITLRVHEQQPIPKWPKLISLNSLIAIFTAIMKAALLMPVAEGICQTKWQHFSNRPRPVVDLNTFDAASRGPWGSLLLLLKAPRQLLVSFGAVITVLALAIDPFSQQVIGYYSCPQMLSDITAVIPRTNNYSQAGVLLDGGARSMDANMTAAIYAALYNPAANASSLIPFRCPTGNCTFAADSGAAYSSLGMCHSYKDITDTVKKLNRSSGDVTLGSFSIASGAQVSYGTTSYRDQSVALNISSVDDDYSALSMFDVLTFSCGGNTTYHCDRPYAFRSSFYPCVRTYGAVINNFVLEEKEVQSTALISPGKARLGDWVLATNTTLRNGIWHDCNATSAKTSENTVPYSPATGNSTSADQTTKYYPEDCIWNFTADAMNSFSRGLYFFFKGRSMSSLRGPQPWESEYGYLIRLGNNYSADASSVNQWLTQLADSMTATMRQTGDTKQDGYATGRVVEYQTCVVVRWEWLSLPAVLLVLAATFTIITIIRSIRSPQQPVWKSSDLVLLYHGFRDSAVNDYGAFDSAQAMEKLSKTVEAQLVVDAGKRWMFRPVNSDSDDTASTS